LIIFLEEEAVENVAAELWGIVVVVVVIVGNDSFR
jgi:hypothetical protein